MRQFIFDSDYVGINSQMRLLGYSQQVVSSRLKRRDSLIPCATDRKPALLTAVGPAHIRIGVIQAPVPGVVTTAGRRRPEVTVVTHTAVVPTVVVAVTTRKGSETTLVGCTGVRAIPMRGACFF